MPEDTPGMTIRFDLRVPRFAQTTFAEQHRACLDMCEWAEKQGFDRILLSEHHGDPGGYMSSPLTVAAAILGRTRHIEVQIAALLVPLHDPVRLAEQIATIDCIAPGRLSIVTGAGYREAEFEMAGLDRATRGRRVRECVELWEKAWTGEPFEWQGRDMLVTPPPATAGGPEVMMGGKSEAAARRAGRMRRTFFPANADPALRTAYEEECRKIGFAGRIEGAPAEKPAQPGFVMLSRDPEATWAKIGPHALWDAVTYAAWQEGTLRSVWFVPDTSDLAALRASGNFAVVTPRECLELIARHGTLSLHPLMGGIAPDLAWESLKLLETEVLPELSREPS